MHNKEQYPAIWAEKEAAESELAPLMAARAKHTDAMAELQPEIDALNTKKVALSAKAKKDLKRITELRNKISRFALSMGAVQVGK